MLIAALKRCATQKPAQTRGTGSPLIVM